MSPSWDIAPWLYLVSKFLANGCQSQILTPGQVLRSYILKPLLMSFIFSKNQLLHKLKIERWTMNEWLILSLRVWVVLLLDRQDIRTLVFVDSLKINILKRPQTPGRFIKKFWVTLILLHMGYKAPTVGKYSCHVKWKNINPMFVDCGNLLTIPILL